MEKEKNIEQLQEQLDSVNAAGVKKDELIEKLTAKLETLIVKDEVKTAVIISDVVEVDGKKYQFKAARFGLPGYTEVMNAADVINNAEVLAAIVAIEGQGILQEIF